MLKFCTIVLQWFLCENDKKCGFRREIQTTTKIFETIFTIIQVLLNLWLCLENLLSPNCKCTNID